MCIWHNGQLNSDLPCDYGADSHVPSGRRGHVATVLAQLSSPHVGAGDMFRAWHSALAITPLSAPVVWKQPTPSSLGEKQGTDVLIWPGFSHVTHAYTISLRCPPKWIRHSLCKPGYGIIMGFCGGHWEKEPHFLLRLLYRASVKLWSCIKRGQPGSQ